MNGIIPTGPVPAVTGALHWINRDSFKSCSLNEDYEVNGEDVELCLDIQKHEGKQVWLCTEATAIHEAETTRSKDPLQGSNSRDRLRLRARTQEYLSNASVEQLRVIMQQQQREIQQLRDLVHRDSEEVVDGQNRLEEQEEILLSLREERLRLIDELDAKEDSH